MIAIILAIVVIVLSIVLMKAHAEANTIFTPRGIKEHAKYTWMILCHDRVCTVGTHTWNKTNMALCITFTMLSMVLVDTGFFVANVMQNNGTHVAGMGWILIASYVLGTVGCIGYAVGCGAHVMNRANSTVVILPPAPDTKCYVL